MFTGLILGVGTVSALDKKGDESRLRIRPHFSLTDCEYGESIAVNGVCLTVETFGRDWFTVYASAETLRRSNLGGLRPGDAVNLERALAVGDRLGGHLVSGHVDCLARIEQITAAGQSTAYTLGFPKQWGPFVVDKGSVCLDGISLTVNACTPTTLAVNIIPTTRKETTIASWQVGSQVNMEVDIIGKYVQKMVAPWSGEPAGEPETGQGLTLDFLREHGF
ncbi:riboflavin synthase [Desulfohalobium retbaense]|uniref:Riboflavin synthase n=1 Tax=Desulfohalobium retbaense (strain ATCC 49708 / DSM 5692 / JCM 16813 / HR100) TaxID=485915 RepID=C8X2R1_DESRD|nr:riboflavin synthase [Desulfohalobium retbaense]ACV68708.1 riboflavin synthase, alpha subunit [Desulfohalobium retbaense DSM 5692]